VIVVASPPSLKYEHAFLAMLQDFEKNDPHNAEIYAPAREDFEKYVHSLLDEEAGLNLPENYVPCSHRWLISLSQQIVGVARIRHQADTPFLAENAGHIGYDVAPSHRRNGFGHIALATSVGEAKRLGLSRVLLYAAEANLASRAVIERAGGRLVTVAFSQFWQEQLCKYWLYVPTEA
jgi:predicted acetyltransferase